jgi:capsular exopolysaccharide synthesis family protein
LSELDVENQTGALNIEVIDYGRPSNTPASPDRVGMMVYALAGGFGLAFGLVMLRSFSDKRIRTVEEVPRLLNLNVVGVMPRIKGVRARKRTGRIVEEEPGSIAGEAIRCLRTATTFALPKTGRGVVLVTSAVSGEGKSVTASNLAFALATGGRRTLLIDGDLRAPSLHEVYGVANDVGLGHVMSRATTISKVVVQNVAAGLDLMPAGDAFGKPADLFESSIFPELIGYVRNKYDCVVIDSPPILESSEGRVMAGEVDLNIFVTRLAVSLSPNAMRALGILRGVDARVLGVFVNDDRTKKSSAYAGGISYGTMRKVEAMDTPTAPRSDVEV